MPAPATSPVPPSPRECPVCRYDLSGLSDRGTCPECSAQYAPQPPEVLHRHPGQLLLFLWIIWPLGALAAFIWGLGTSEAMLAMFGVVVSFGWCLFSIFFSAPIMVRLFLPRRSRTRWRWVNLWRLGSFVLFADLIVCGVVLYTVLFVVDAIFFRGALHRSLGRIF